MTLLGLLAAGCVDLAATSVRADVADTIAQVGRVPNYFYQHHPERGTDSTDVVALVDRTAHRVLEYDKQYSCPILVALDSDTFATTATSTSAPSSACGGLTDIGSFNRVGPSPVPIADVDETDHVVFGSEGAGLGAVVGLSTLTLKTVATWSVSPQAMQPVQTQVIGISWAPAYDDLIVATANPIPGDAEAFAGLAITAYSIPSGLQPGSTGEPLWTTVVTDCSGPFKPTLGTQSAYETADAVFVPCTLTNQRIGIVKLPLGTAGCTQPATRCPSGSEDVAVVPGSPAAFVFDLAADRAEAITTVVATGVSAMVYDGSAQHGTFIGRTAIGGPDDIIALVVGLDQRTGRFYSVGPSYGLTAVDGRRTPVRGGQTFPGFANGNIFGLFPVLEPDTAFPFTRVIVPDEHGFFAGSPYTPDFLIYADRLPVGQDPPQSSVDQGTTAGPIPRDATVSTTFGGTARGYGFHTDFVNGPNGFLDDAGLRGDVTGVPFGQGSKDLLGGDVVGLSASNGSAYGDASSLNDANGATANGLAQCSNLQQPSGCQPPPPAFCSQDPLQCGALYQPDTQLPKTQQAWIVNDAFCANPPADAAAPPARTGLWVTTGYQPPDANGYQKPIRAEVSGSDADASASVDCTFQGKPVEGAAQIQGFDASPLSAAGIPEVSVGSASATTSVTLPSDGDRGVSSTTTAVARSIHIPLPTGDLEIGEVVHRGTAAAAGLPGTTAIASSTVTLSNIVFGGADLCGTTCDPRAVIAQLNSLMAGQAEVILPAPDDPFHTCTSDAAGYHCAGSPGGYLAAVQAPAAEREGDRQFNGMSTEEASLLPGLRIVLYGYNDGTPTLSREILDLAGIEDDAHKGYQVLNGGSVVPMPSIPEMQMAAGLLPNVDSGHGDAGSVVGNPPGTAQPQSPTGPLGIIERTFSGIAALWRSPGEALRMLAFLTLLGLPFVVMRRRWTGTTFEGADS